MYWLTPVVLFELRTQISLCTPNGQGMFLLAWKIQSQRPNFRFELK